MTNEQTIQAVLNGKMQASSINDQTLRMQAYEALAQQGDNGQAPTVTASFDAQIDTTHLRNRSSVAQSLANGPARNRRNAAQNWVGRNG